MTIDERRRAFLRQAAIAASAGTVAVTARAAQQRGPRATKTVEDEPGGEVTATEDLMREHGVLRRALLAYASAAPRLRADPRSVPSDALQRTARLFRAFGEEYHEKKLEEAHIFPAVRKTGGPAASYPDVLLAQHERGREITDFVLFSTRGSTIAAAGALADALDGFVRMYEHHTAREDTIVFPAWKAALGERRLDEMGELFEEIEHREFGHDGFEDAVRQIGEIEQTLGIANIAQFTPPQPPRAED